MRPYLKQIMYTIKKHSIDEVNIHKHLSKWIKIDCITEEEIEEEDAEDSKYNEMARKWNNA